jgi:predicted phosphate transport protein (TIGR00153 family)
MFNLSPKEVKFFVFFDEFGKIVSEATEMLKRFTYNLENPEVKFREIEEIEHRGDRLLHDIMEALNKTYLTPFDREDIYAIAKALDDIVDFVEATASRFILFNVNEVNEYAKVLADKIAQSGNEVITLMKELRNMKNNKKLTASIIEINKLEDLGDSDFRVAVRSLFTSQVPDIEVIKWREIYEFYEQTLDACEDLADIVEGVVMKHA